MKTRSFLWKPALKIISKVILFSLVWIVSSNPVTAQGKMQRINEDAIHADLSLGMMVHTSFNYERLLIHFERFDYQVRARTGIISGGVLFTENTTFTGAPVALTGLWGNRRLYFELTAGLALGKWNNNENFQISDNGFGYLPVITAGLRWEFYNGLIIKAHAEYIGIGLGIGYGF